MSAEARKGNGRDGPVRVDFAFRRELAEKIEGNLASFCYQCGACVGDCPATTYGSGFNPREIMLKVLYGLGEELVCEDSIIWHCTNCYSCHERCPQEVKPVEVIISLKNMLADRGILPETVKKVIGAFEQTGRTVPHSPAVDKARAKYGLPPLVPVPIEEIRELIRPEAEEEEISSGEGEETAPEGEGRLNDPGSGEKASHADGGGEAAALRGGSPGRKEAAPVAAAPAEAGIDPDNEITRPLPILRDAGRK